MCRCRCGRPTRRDRKCNVCRAEALRAAKSEVRRARAQRRSAYEKWRATDPLSFARSRVTATIGQFARDRTSAQLRKSLIPMMRSITLSCDDSQRELLHEGLKLYPDGLHVGVTLQRALEIEIEKVEASERRKRASGVKHIYRGGLPGSGK